MTNQTMIPAWVDGKLTPVEKLDAHRRGLRHKAVSVFVTDGDFLLLQRRAMTKYHTPGLWANTCCTHPGWEEPTLVCAERRLSEELGISGLTLRHADRVEYRAEVGGGLIEHEVVDLVVAEATRAMVVAMNPDEVMDYEWIDVEDLAGEIEDEPDRFTPWLRIYMAEHKDKIFADPVTAAE
ncbi:MAG: isopentenyl-diphosphate delta-isomerase [Pseudomonadota bacterium]